MTTHRARQEYCLCGCGTKLIGLQKVFAGMDHQNTWRNDQRKIANAAKQIRCAYCGKPLDGHGNARHCNEECKAASVKEMRKTIKPENTVDSICPYFGCGRKHKGTTKWEACHLHRRLRYHSDYTDAAGSVRA